MIDQIPQLQKIRNDNADDIAINWGVFIGRWAVVPFIAGIIFITLFNFMSSIGFDPLMSLIISLSPGVIMTIIMVVLVNTKPPGYALELAQMGWFKGHEWLYLKGLTDDVPQIWYTGKPVRNPRE